MVPDGQKVWTDGRNGQTDDAKTISLRLRRGIISILHLALIHVFPEDSGGNTKWLKTSAVGAQWLSGRVLDSRPRGCGFELHQCHCVVVLEQDTFILA